MLDAYRCTVNVTSFHPSLSVVSTHILCFVYGYYDSKVTNPLHFTIDTMWILPVSQATCFSTQYHLSSLSVCFSYFLEQNRIIYSNKGTLQSLPLSCWHAASDLQSLLKLKQNFPELTESPKILNMDPSDMHLSGTGPWLTNYLFPSGFHRENRIFRKSTSTRAYWEVKIAKAAENMWWADFKENYIPNNNL